MLMTSDGKKFVFGLFGADGCECENLEALFESEEAALQRMKEIQADAKVHDRFNNLSRAYKTGDCYGDPDYLEVRQLELR